MNNGLASGHMGLEGRGEKARRQKHEGGTKPRSSSSVAPCASLTWLRNSNALFSEPVTNES